MNSTKTSTRIIWIIIMLWVLHGLLFLSWRMFYSLHHIHSFHVSLLYLSKILCYAGILFIGISLYRLWKKYAQQGFFDEKSVQIVRTMGIIMMIIGLPNSIYNVLRHVILPAQEKGELPIVGKVIHHFFIDYMFESTIFLLVGMLIFLFADFMKKAISVKNDNESII